MKASLGVLALALGTERGAARRRRRWASACAGATSGCCARAGATCSWCSSRRSPRSRVMEWALSPTTSRSSTWPRTTPGRRRCCTRSPGLWAALEGSILLWGLILGGYLAAMVLPVPRPRDRSAGRLGDAHRPRRRTLLLRAHARPGEPVPARSGRTPADGQGPNPLLQNHPLMAFHPPMLYLGYVGFTMPFCFAIASLVTGRFGEGWLADTRRATLVAWGFLTVGIVLGVWWSYEVLGWGGYWAWDPVENASLLPWLTATAFIHSVIVQERRGMLRVWNLSLVIATFCLTILGHVPHPVRRAELGPLVHPVRRSGRRCSGSSAWSRPSGSASSRGGATGCARPGASTRRCRASRRSSPTTSCSPGSRSWCSSARCTRCWPRRCRGASSRWASPTSTG